MSTASLFLRNAVVGALTAAFSFCLVTSAGLANPNDVSEGPEALRDFRPAEDNGFGGNNGFNPLDLIHNANFYNQEGTQLFKTELGNRVDSAADDFRKQQLQRIRQQRQEQSTPTLAPQADETVEPTVTN